MWKGKRLILSVLSGEVFYRVLSVKQRDNFLAASTTACLSDAPAKSLKPLKKEAPE